MRGQWLNSPQVADLGGRAVLLDFWDYTCLDCLRTLPTIQRLAQRYPPLTVIGVHTPQFAFGREQTQVEWALQEFGLAYPILLDNDYALWNRYGNEFWPMRLLIDAQGRVRYQGMSAGNALERILQTMLREEDATLDLPALSEDDPLPPDFVAPPPELRGGSEGGALGNPQGYAGVAPMLYTLPEQRTLGAFYVSGAWQASREFLTYRGTTEGLIELPYEAAEVYAVLSPHHDTVERMLHPEIVPVEVWQDDLPILGDQRGDDLTEDGRLLLDRPRLYHLIRNPGFERHALSLRVHVRGFTLYTFSFVGGVRRTARRS